MPFIDEGPRKLREIAERFDRRLRWEVVKTGVSGLWVYGGRRACCVDGETCGFLLGQADLAFVEVSQNIAGAVTAWLLEGATLADLAGRGVQLQPHAEVLEVNPARWHWLHVRDRITNPKDVLAPLAELIGVPATSPVASRFYTFLQLDRLCFSASSHYPWVGRYPPVWSSGGRYCVGDVRCPLGDDR